MKNKNVHSISTVAIAAIFISGLLFGERLLSTPSTAHSQETISSMPQRYITVVGEGIVNIKPDIAKTTIGVETVKASVKEASIENQAIIADVLAALKAAGIADKDMQTAGFNMYAEQMSNPDSKPEDAPQMRYHVTNQVQITIRDTEKVGEVLDAAIEAGANNSYGIEFNLDDQKSARADARTAAIENAGDRAEELAGLTGVTVGRVLSISEVIGSNPFFGASEARAFGGLGGGGGIPISVGELQLTAQVQVIYEIE